jgi:DNA-binding MurR/RpiR family transcriptional regulator
MTAGHGSKRAQREDAAIAALLSEPTIAEAATKAGISESTLLRWLQEPGFKGRCRAARRSVVESAIGRLQQAASQAVDALVKNLTCGVPAVEVGAAKSVLDQALKAVELVDLAERIEALEQAAELAAQREEGKRR